MNNFVLNNQYPYIDLKYNYLILITIKLIYNELNKN